MPAQTYRDRLRKFVSSGHSVVTLLDCSTPKGSKAFTLYQVDRQVMEVETETISIPPNTVVLDYREFGSAAIRREGDHRPLVVSPNVVSFFSTGTYHVRSAKGRHRSMLLVSHPSAGSAVHDYIRESKVEASVKSFSPETQKRIGQLSAAIEEDEGPSFFVVAGIFYSSMSVLLKQRFLVDFGEIPKNLSGVFQGICEHVRSDPTGDWSIESASKMVSYSPQYFSRTFKATAGEGFHTFVQRVRLSRAIGMITEGELRTGVLVKKAGFASLQAMRETFRSELGLLPSDFKAVMDAKDQWPSTA